MNRRINSWQLKNRTPINSVAILHQCRIEKDFRPILANADVIESLHSPCCSSGALMQILRGEFCQLAYRDVKLRLGSLNLHIVPLERRPLASSFTDKTCSGVRFSV